MENIKLTMAQMSKTEMLGWHCTNRVVPRRLRTLIRQSLSIFPSKGLNPSCITDSSKSSSNQHTMSTNTRQLLERPHHQRRRHRRQVLPQSSLNSIRLGVIPEDESPHDDLETTTTKQTTALPSNLMKVMQKYHKQQRRTEQKPEPVPSASPAIGKSLPADLLKVMTRYKANPPEMSQRKSSAGSAA